jgi:hypothetical protein
MAVSLDAFSNGAKRRTGGGANEPDDDLDFRHAEAPKRDPKKVFLVAGLGILSWVATYVGMLELIEANMGELPLIHKVIIGFSVAMLMTMIVWLLDQMFAPGGFITRLLYVAGYVFLSVISIGFGFGFYWKVLESRSESSRSAESAVAQVQGSLNTAATRLEQLSGTLVSLTAISTQKAEQERANGTSCPNSKPGEGPRRKMREDDAARFQFASDFVKGRVSAVKNEITALDVDLIKIVKDDKSIVDAKSGTRNDFMRALSRKLDMTVTGFNAFRTDPQLKQIRSDLAERSDKTTIPDSKGGSISCPDPQLQGALKGVVRAIDQLPELQKPTIAAVEGSEATIEAFRRLTASFYGLLSFKLPPSADELRALQQKAVQSVESPTTALAKSFSAEQAGLSKRDYVPLAIAIFVDICLLLVSMGRPMNRLQGLVPKMVAAERGPVYQILSRFSDIHADAEMRQKFEIFRHVVFDYGGDYYVAVPLDAPRNKNPREQQDLLAEAHLLSNLFSSFEKEKIFKRVYSPLLSTSAIQKKLGRQGSKFTHCKAFRIYRFADGAWSEIILGAVMGAAKRVGAEKRRRRDEQAELVAAGGPSLPSALAEAFRAASPHARPDIAGELDREFPPVGTPLAPRGYQGPRMARSAAAPQGYGPAGFAQSSPARPAAMPQPMSAPANDAIAAFGPYAQFQAPMAAATRPEPRREADVTQWSAEIARREAEVSVRPHEIGAPRRTENVVAMPLRPAALTAAGSGVDVELTRETIRYTMPNEPTATVTMVPTTEAVLPAALAAIGRAARVAAPPATRIAADPVPADIDDHHAADHADDAAVTMAARLIRREPAE